MLFQEYSEVFDQIIPIDVCLQLDCNANVMVQVVVSVYRFNTSSTRANLKQVSCEVMECCFWLRKEVLTDVEFKRFLMPLPYTIIIIIIIIIILGIYYMLFLQSPRST